MQLTESFRLVLPQDVVARYEIREVRNAATVLQSTNPEAFDELVSVLQDFHLTRTDVLVPGGNEGTIAKRLNQRFRRRGWREGRFDLRIVSELRLSPYGPAGETKPRVETAEVFNEGYKVDNVKDRTALDVEWNAKDGNLDRDVSAYRALYDAAIIDLGVIVTRTHNDLRLLGRRLGRDEFLETTTTTSLEKLEPKLTRGDAGGCPLLAIAITARCYRA